jgi:uncharacterized protein YodC (DUF2158 family)
MMEFSAGDLVQLKSGGPKMTVKKIGRDGMTKADTVWCIWFQDVKGK